MTLVQKAAERVTDRLVEQRLVESSKKDECLGIVHDVLEEVFKEAGPNVATARFPDPPEIRRTNI
jgi:hypothetical protein